MYRRSFRARPAIDVKMPRDSTSRSTFENHGSNWFIHDDYVGVKGNVTFECSCRNASTSVVLVSEQIVEDHVGLLVGRAGWPPTSPRRLTKSRLVCRAVVLPSTSPVCTFNTA